MTGTIAKGLILGAAFIALCSPAFADAIDGHWCRSDGRRMSIEGSRIVTPGGTSMIGGYDRHGFAYVVPAGAPGAGGRTTMVLVSDDVIRLTLPGQGPGPNPPVTEIWRRCDLTM